MRVFLYALGSLDGIFLKIRQTTVKEMAQRTLYHCRKGFHVLNVQATCDTHKRYTYCVIDMSGSTHDSRSFANSNLAHSIGAGCFPDHYYFLGNSTYKGTSSILTPYTGNLRTDESVFSALPCHSTYNLLCVRYSSRPQSSGTVPWKTTSEKMSVSCSKKTVVGRASVDEFDPFSSRLLKWQ